MSNIIIGGKFFGHDSAIFYLDPENKKIFAISTERITRIKHDAFTVKPIFKVFSRLFSREGRYFLVHSFSNFSHIDACFESEARSYFVEHIWDVLRKVYHPRYVKDWSKLIKRIKSVYFRILTLSKYRDPKFIKLLFEYYTKFKYSNLVTNSENKYYVTKLIDEIVRDHIKNYSIEFVNHHLSHAASAYYPSPFNKSTAIVFTLDGWGDREFSTVYKFNNKNYEKLHSSKTLIHNRYIFSIGNLYSKFTKVLGFIPLSDEGKTEALAAYGTPNKKLFNMLYNAVYIDDANLSFVINKDSELWNERYLYEYMEKIGKKNFASTIQRWLEEIVVSYLNLVYKEYRIKRLAMAGGVIGNVILNLNIFEKTPFTKFYIAPWMGDGGTSVGAAILKAIELGYDISWLNKKMEMPYFGPSYTKDEVQSAISRFKEDINYKYISNSWPKIAAKMIADGKVVAIFNGKMEFGPRALGNRSILADPRDPKTRDKINSTVKKRPWFQPFCPSVLEEDRKKLFENSYKHKHMAIAFRVKKKYRNKIPSAMHIDGTARPQFVEKRDNPKYYQVIKEFKKLTGFGVLVNTSFNLHGRTIVMSPIHAMRDFIDCNIDAMFIEGFLVTRKSKSEVRQ